MSKLQGAKTSRTLPPVNTEMKSKLIEGATFDTRSDKQKANAKPKKKPKTVTLDEDSIAILDALVDITEKSERTILGELLKQALKKMVKKIEIAKEVGMIPPLKLD